LSPDAITSCLAAHNATDLHIDLAEHEGVTWKFLSQMYGGNSRSVIARIGKSTREKHGHDLQAMFFANPATKPYAPSAIGQSGLILHMNGMEFADRTHPLFFRVRESRWVYAGHYFALAAQPLTVAEWTEIDPEVRLRMLSFRNRY
jgi:hypothetical protein